MMSSRPTPHHHAHKENTYGGLAFPSRTPARGLGGHKDAGARTVGKAGGPLGSKTPFGGGQGGGLGKASAMTTGRKGLGASLGPGRGNGQAAEGNIEPMRLFQSSCAKPSSSTVPHSKSATFAPASTKPSFGDVTNASVPSHALRTPGPPSKRAFATPAPARAAAKQAVFQTPLPSATRTTRRRSSKLHTATPLAGDAPPSQPAFSTPTDRTLPADASFELDLAPAAALTDLLEKAPLAAAADDEVEYMPAFSSREHVEPASFAYDVPDPVALGREMRSMGVVQWDEGMADGYRAEAARSPVGWEESRWEGPGWKAQAGWSDNSEGGYDSDEDLAALLNLPVSALKSHQRAGAASKPLSLASASSATAPTRRSVGGLGASRPTPSTTATTRPTPSTVPRRAAAPPAAAATAAPRQRTTTAPAPSAARRPLPSSFAPTSTSTAASARPRPPPSTLSARPPPTTSRAPAVPRPAAQPTPAERDLTARLKRRDDALAERAFILARLDEVDAGSEQDVGFALDA